LISTIAIEAKFRKVLRRYGFELYRTATLKRGAQYDLNIPHANYAPWNVDGDFLEVFSRIKDDCFVDKYRCHELWQTVKQTAGLSGAIIEVGVWRGGTASIIASAARKSGSKEPIYLCENFKGVVKPSGQDTHYRGGEHADSSVEKIRHYLEGVFHIADYRLLDGIFPEETGEAVKGERFKFAHIDVDTYQSAKDAFEFIFARMISGGCIVFDDYGFSRCDGVTKLVDGLFGRADLFLIHNLNGHAVLYKR
jgi:O-methyltransferase